MIGSLATCSTNNSLPCRRAMSKAVLSAFSEEGAKLTGTRMRFHSGFIALFCDFSVIFNRTSRPFLGIYRDAHLIFLMALQGTCPPTNYDASVQRRTDGRDSAAIE